MKWLFISRHGERIDRFEESQGRDWINSAERPQDPSLSASGMEQIASQGVIMHRELEKLGATLNSVFCSPTIRCVQTSHIYLDNLGTAQHKINVETGLLEEAKSFRGRDEGEKKPAWTPLILPASSLKQWSDRVDEEYEPFVTVNHVHTDLNKNEVLEVHQSDTSLTDHQSIMDARIIKLLECLTLRIEEIPDKTAILAVTHGAIVKNLTKVLNGGKAYGTVKALTGSFTVFSYDSEGKWSAVYDEFINSAYVGEEHARDQGSM